MDIKDLINDIDWNDDYLELTFPDCPKCMNIEDGKCRFSNICTVRVLHGERFGCPSHLNVISTVNKNTMKYI